jgi:amino acid transporter
LGVLPGERLAASPAPMAAAASVYLPFGAAWFVTLGAVMALTTSLNATMLVPSRLAVVLARDRLAPRWLGAIESRTGTPVRALTGTLAAAAVLVLTGQVSLALNIAVFALVALYLLHSLALLLLPRSNPALFRSVTVRIPIGVQRFAAVLSMLAMAGLLLVQGIQDVQTLTTLSLAERIAHRSVTTLELCLAWGIAGAAIYLLGRRKATRSPEVEDPGLQEVEAEPETEVSSAPDEVR